MAGEAQAWSVTTPHLIDRGKLFPMPLWRLLLKDDDFRDSVLDLIGKSVVPVAARGHEATQGLSESPSPARSQRPGSALSHDNRIGVADRSWLALPPAVAASLPYRLHLWLSRLRWKSGPHRFLEVSAQAALLRPWSSGDASTPPYFHPRVLKEEPVVAHLSAEVLLRSRPVRDSALRFWDAVPKVSSSTRPGSESEPSVGRGTWVQLHVAIQGALLLGEYLQWAEVLDAAQDFAQSEWTKLVGDGFAMGRSLFVASLLMVIEPWMETTETAERVEALSLILATVYPDVSSDPEHRVVDPRSWGQWQLEYDSVEVTSTSMHSAAEKPELNRLVDRLDTAEVLNRRPQSAVLRRRLAIPPPGAQEADLVEWRKKLRQSRSRIVENQLRSGTTQPRRDLPGRFVAKPDDMILEKVMLSRVAAAVRDSRKFPVSTFLEGAGSEHIPESALKVLLRRYPKSVDEFRAAVEGSTVIDEAQPGPQKDRGQPSMESLAKQTVARLEAMRATRRTEATKHRAVAPLARKIHRTASVALGLQGGYPTTFGVFSRLK